MVNKAEFAYRRKQLMQQLNEHSIVIITAAPIVRRNHTHEYHYRQHSDFYYLTGFTEPDAVLLLAPNRVEGEYLLFSRPDDPDTAIWE